MTSPGTGVPVPQWRAIDEISDAFTSFHLAHPAIYRKLVELARVAKLAGLSRYSMKALFEVLRWQWVVEGVLREPLPLNNNYTSRYARLIEENEDDLRGFFSLRQAKSLYRADEQTSFR